jgi:hypothetical protein
VNYRYAEVRRQGMCESKGMSASQCPVLSLRARQSRPKEGTEINAQNAVYAQCLPKLADAVVAFGAPK